MAQIPIRVGAEGGMTVNPKISFSCVKTRFLDEGQSCRPQKAYQSIYRRVTGMHRPRGCIIVKFFVSHLRCSYGTDLAFVSCKKEMWDRPPGVPDTLLVPPSEGLL